MSTHSKKEKKTKDKNSTTKSYSNKSEKVSWWDTVKNEPVSKFFKDTAASAKKRQSDILKKEQSGYYDNVPLKDTPVGVGFRKLLNKKAKLDQVSMGETIKKSKEIQKNKKTGKKAKKSSSSR